MEIGEKFGKFSYEVGIENWTANLESKLNRITLKNEIKIETIGFAANRLLLVHILKTIAIFKQKS